MSSIQSRAKHLESIISISLLVVLFLIGAAVFVKQGRYEKGRFNPDLGVMKEAGTAQVQELSGFVPDGFVPMSQSEKYTAESLYEKINGKAEMYLDAGFTGLMCRRFVSTNNADSWFEVYVYQMASSKAAFSVFSMQRRPEADVVSLFNESNHYKTSNALYLFDGNYYIEMVGSSESRQLFSAIIETAQDILVHLKPDDSGMIPEIAIFPTDNLITSSINLYLSGAFGFAGFANTFTAKYQIADQNITVFLSKQDNAESAQKIVNAYKDFLIENGATAKKTNYEILKGGVIDFYDTTEIVLSAGPFVIGIHEAENQTTAEQLVLNLIKKIENDREYK